MVTFVVVLLLAAAWHWRNSDEMRALASHRIKPWGMHKIRIWNTGDVLISSLANIYT
jgi:hypothetical protein